MQVFEPTVSTQGRLRRLIQMGLPELACRGRQETLKWVERFQSDADLRRRRASRGIPRTAQQYDASSLKRFLSDCEARFFEGPFDRRLPGALAIQAPRHLTDLLANADENCYGRFDLLGYRGLAFGDPLPSWHFDPISGHRAPLRHWSLLDPLDYTTVGDSKVIWELNRHQWMVRLGQAYRMTGNERYCEAVVRYLEDWLHHNPPGLGINWTSSLEVGLRLISWCWCLLLIRESPALTPDLFAKLIHSIDAHATHVERYLSYYFSPNTHLTGEALGLLYAGIVFPSLKRAERWQSLATRVLAQEIERQVLSDGVYFERSTCYQRYTIDMYLHFLILGSRAGFEIPAGVEERLRRMLDFLLAVLQPDGSMPNIGDADGGCLLPLGTNSASDVRSTFSTAAVVFREPSYAWAAGELAPETLWLLGTSAFEIFAGIKPSPPASEPCRMFPAGGFAVLRGGWEEDSHALIFDTGPLGCPVSSGHGHADLLSIQCSAFGRPYLVDAGTGCYTASPELRNFFRGTASHSTVMIDCKGQADPAGPFAWQRRSSGHLLHWASHETLAFADAEHDGYRALPDPVFHRRQVIFVKPRYWVVIDDLMGAGSHLIENRFQFAPMEVSLDIAGWTRATWDGREGLLVHAYATSVMEAQLREGQRTPIEGWLSPNYGEFEPAPVLVYTATTLLPIRLVTLLWPTRDVQEEAPRVDIVRERTGHPIGLVFPERAETLMFEDGEPVLDRACLVSSS